MKKEKVVSQVKDIIMNELFMEVSNQKCLLDIVLGKTKESEGRKSELSDTSRKFVNKCQDSLREELNKGNILFFRKYNYEKILNDYLTKLYQVENLEMEMFPSEKKKRALETAEKAEKQRIENEKRVAERKKIVEKVICCAKEAGWIKKSGGNKNTYVAQIDNNKVEFCTESKCKRKGNAVSKLDMEYMLIIDCQVITAAEYNPETLLQNILSTKPREQQKEGMIFVVNKNWKHEKSEKEAKRQKAQEERAKKVAEYQEKVKRQQEEEERKKQEEKRRILEKQRKIDAERKKKEEQLQKELKGLPLIDVRDFVVRRAIFKCMHSNHNVKNIDAAVRILDHKDEERLVKISAGYCEECKIYFIMESTYQSLKNKGIILCRISDEKTYMKNSYVNGMKLAQESILMQYGYNVSQNEGLTATRRQKILAVIMDHDILSRSEIISYLDFFINQRQYQSKFELAVSKWEADREFVESYRWGEYRRYGVNGIFRI